MAHFAEIREDNNEVVRIIVVGNDDVDAHGGDYSIEAEEWVASFHPNCPWLLNNVFNGVYPKTYWKQTSIHVSKGVHSLGKTPMRKNTAGIGFIYDKNKDAFIVGKFSPGYVLDEEICQWVPSIAEPTIKTYGDNSNYTLIFDNDNMKWFGFDNKGDKFEWIPSSSLWISTGM